MPLPATFKMSEQTNFSEQGEIVDYNVNSSPDVKYNDGQVFQKSKGQTFVDITIKVLSGKRKGETFVQENVNTAVYVSKTKGKSGMYMLLSKIGVKDEVLQQLAGQTIPDFNLMNTVGRKFDGVKENREGVLYIDLRDPEFVEKKSQVDPEEGMFSETDEEPEGDEQPQANTPAEPVKTTDSKSLFDD